ncbi:MAG: site-specific DNA-methyltransferase [Elusimicrobiaceae bacterium]|nr:site-specific DNA-methyltransferase [Elusimicrobiaceae bacterium]
MTEKMKFETKDLTQENIAKIGQLFPEVLTEAKDDNGTLKKAIDFDKLRQILSDSAIDNRETYDFTWVGKKQAILEAATPIRKTLRPCKEDSVNWDTTQNLYIEGDNLDVLKLLQESYLGKVKMIYIDPPYNTGNDFIYRDDFAMSQEEYEESGERIDEEGNRLVKNTDSNGRFHSDWCSMMYPRLKLARNLLTDDGVIFISIDDNEVENLRKICDEVFGEENFVTTIHCQMSTTQGMKVKAAQDGNIVKNAEYILCYSKDGHQDIAKCPLYDLRPEYDEHYSLFLKSNGEIGQLSELYDYRFPKDCNNKKPLKLAEAYKKSEEFAEIVRSHLAEIVRSDKSPDCEDITELRQGYWKEIDRKGKKYLLTLDSKGNMRQLLRLKDSWGITDGYYQEDGLRKIRGDWWSGFYIDMGNVSKEGGIAYKNGKKPVRLIKQLTKMLNDSKGIFLDFFSGSATTAHAVMRLNAEDGGNRKFIMVQLPEECDKTSEAYKAGYKNICEIGKERIRRAAKQIKEEHPESNFDGGFRVFKLAGSNMKDVYYNPADYTQDLLSQMTSNIKEDRNDMDLLYGCMLEWGLPLSYPHTSEKVGSYTIHTVNNGDLVACFDENVTEDIIRHIAAKKPLRVVFRDAGFTDSPAKINVGELFKLLSPDTKVKVI